MINTTNILKKISVKLTYSFAKAKYSLFDEKKQLIKDKEQLIKDKEQLTQEKKALSEHAADSQYDTRMAHRPYSNLCCKQGFSKGTKYENTNLIARLLHAYSTVQTAGSESSIWLDIYNNHHENIHEIFISQNISQANEILSNPRLNNLFYGFDDICQSMNDGHYASNNTVALTTQDNLIRLLEAIGEIPTINPEYFYYLPDYSDKRKEFESLTTDEALELLDNALGKSFNFPDIYPEAVGAVSSRGIISYRAITSIYLICRVKEIIDEYFHGYKEVRICEIGGGLGRSAYYAKLFGMNNYSLVDIPMTAISQGYYLTRCLGEESVVLPGEQRTDKNQVKIMHPDEFFRLDEEYDLIINMDSITEFGTKTATDYIQEIGDKCKIFFSVNHEANVPRVFDLVRQIRTDDSHPIYLKRTPSWIRNGYIEEVIKFLKFK